MSIIKPGRKQGNSTRQIDEAIQNLFDSGMCTVWDHWCDTTKEKHTQNQANEELMSRVLGRLSREHPFVSIKRYENILKISNEQ